jgi:hypothetical protein
MRRSFSTDKRVRVQEMNRNEILAKISCNEWKIKSFNISGDEERKLNAEIKEMIQLLTIMREGGH